MDEPGDLQDWEKAYFDAMRDRSNAVSLLRMTLDGEDVAVVAQEVEGTPLGAAKGWMPLAILATPEILGRIRDLSGGGPIPADPSDFVSRKRKP